MVVAASLASVQPAAVGQVSSDDSDAPAAESVFDDRLIAMGVPRALSDEDWNLVGRSLLLSDDQAVFWQAAHVEIMARIDRELGARQASMEELLSQAGARGTPYGMPEYGAFLEATDAYARRFRAIYEEGVTSFATVLGDEQAALLESARSLVVRRGEWSRIRGLRFSDSRMFDIEWWLLEHHGTTGAMDEYHAMRAAHLDGYGAALESAMIEWANELSDARARSIALGLEIDRRNADAPSMSRESWLELNVQARDLAERAARLGDRVARLHLEYLVRWVSERDRALGEGYGGTLWRDYLRSCLGIVGGRRPDLRPLLAALERESAHPDPAAREHMRAVVVEAAMVWARSSPKMARLKLDFDREVGDLRVGAHGDGAIRADYQLAFGELAVARLEEVRAAAEEVLAFAPSGLSSDVRDAASRVLSSSEFHLERVQELLDTGWWPN